MIPKPPSNAAGIRVEIKNEDPVELEDLSESFRGLADEYRRWLLDHASATTTDGVRLYVKQINQGSIVAELVAWAPLALAFAENANTVLGFCEYLKAGLTWLATGAPEQAPVPLSVQNLTNLAKIVEPIAKDSASQMNVGTLNINGPVTFSINSQGANAAQNRARRHIEQTRETEVTTHKKVALYWYQARNDPNATTGDKAIIESISRRPVKAVFVTDAHKRRLLSDNENPFKKAYVVDVAVDTVNGRPALYRILDVYEAIDLEDETIES